MNGLRSLPKIDELLADTRLAGYALSAGRRTNIVRACVQRARERVIGGEEHTREELFEMIVTQAARECEACIAERLCTVINATGIVVHTNLGRAPLSAKAAEHMLALATGYNNLEFSTVTGKRRNRLQYVEQLLCDLTGAQAALVVNNNAAAVHLTLNTLCKDCEVLLSRGEIVEIGDSFRINEIMSLSGCTVREVGTTNRTYLTDYERAITPQTGAIAKIHTSNYRIVGFTAEVASAELAALAQANAIALVEDMGSGVLTDLRRYGLPQTRTVADAVADGVDIITVSGDKMLGGPQAGIILGKQQYIAPMRKNQLLRCLRIDKLSLAALESTLTEYLSGSPDLPVLKLICQPPALLKQRAENLKALLPVTPGLAFEVSAHTAYVGGGAMPSQQLQSWGVLVTSARHSANKLEELLLAARTPVVGTLHPDGLMLDVIAVPDADFPVLAAALASL